MPSLVTTPGDALANSFETVDEFRLYLSTRFPVVQWAIDSTDEELIPLLINGCRILSACFIWTGRASYETQSLPWPRLGMLSRNGFLIGEDIIPQELKDAQSEFCISLGTPGSDITADNAAAKAGVQSVKASSVEVHFQPVSTSTVESAYVAISRTAPEYLCYSSIVPDVDKLV